MQVYHRAQQFMLMVEPSFAFSEERNFTDYINVLTLAVDRHSDKAITMMPELFNIFSEMMNSRGHFSLQDYSEILSVIMKCYNYLSNNDNNFNQQILSCIILALSNISPETSNDWSHPVECKTSSDGEIFQCPEIIICREILENVDDFVLKIGQKNARAYLAPIFMKHSQFNNDWRQKYGALMLASQLTEEVEDLSEVEIYINAALPELASSHPKMRFVALEVFGELGMSIKPDFQEKYFEIIVPELLKLLWDNIPQVVSHVFACLSNFLDDFQQFWKVEAIVNDLISPLLHYLKSDSLYLRQCALETVGCLGGLRNCLGAHAGILIQACGEVLQQSLQWNQPDTVLGAFQSLSVILCNQDQNQMACYVPDFVESLLSNITLINDQNFVEIWERLCKTYKNFVDLNTTNIVPLLMEKVQKVIKVNIDENSLTALNSLIHTVSAFQLNIRPQVSQLCQFCINIFQDKQNSCSVRNKAIELYVKIFLNTIQPNEGDKFYNEGMGLIQYLIKIGDENAKQNDAELLIGVLGGILELIIPLGPRLDKNALLAISDKMMEYKLRIEEFASQEPEQQDQICVVEAKCDGDSSFQDISEDTEEFSLFQAIELIPDIYGKMLKISDPTNRQVLINIIIPQISFTVGKDEDWKSYALNMALSLVEECEYADLIAYWGDLMSLFSSFITHGNYHLRNLSAYGTGLIIKKTPSNLIVGENLVQWLQNLWNSYSAPFDPDQEKSNISHCKENVVAAVGKLLGSCGSSFPHILTTDIYKKWLQFLPLRQDKSECDEQHTILLEIIQSNPSVLMSNEVELKRVLEIIADFILMKNFELDNQVLSDTIKCINNITTWQLFKHCSDNIWNSLSSGQKRALAKLMGHS